MFSEPGAGSDLASLTTAADRGSSGGWSITGQKVWTTHGPTRPTGRSAWPAPIPDAPQPRAASPASCVDMATPGIDIRPLRELTGMAMFNEIFLDDVFVPDDCVVGRVDRRLASAARTTLANERVSMAAGSSFGPGVAALFDLRPTRRGLLDDPLVADQLGALVVDAHAVGDARRAHDAAGPRRRPSPDPRPACASCSASSTSRGCRRWASALLGPRAAVTGEGDGAVWVGGFLGNRALSIAGGTSEIQRNVIAERLLGLPKDP